MSSKLKSKLGAAALAGAASVANVHAQQPSREGDGEAVQTAYVAPERNEASFYSTSWPAVAALGTLGAVLLAWNFNGPKLQEETAARPEEPDVGGLF